MSEGVRHRATTSSLGVLEHHVNVNVDQLAASLESMMPKKLSFTARSCIFKVPYILRRHNAEAYVPTAFSIGPWHRNKSHLKATEEIKLKYLNGLLCRPPCRDTMLKELIRAVLDVEEEACACYSGPIDVGVDEFVKLLVLDGCFVIELLRKNDNLELGDADDPIINVSSMLRVLYHDLILLENQIPWLVLESLFIMTKMESDSKPLSLLALMFFGKCFSSAPLIEPYAFQGHGQQQHILDLLRNWLILSSEETMNFRNNFGWQPIPSAATLSAAGIQIKPAVAKSILDIKFKDGILEIPGLVMEDVTEVIFRNLICYEQCCPGSTDRFSSYATFLDNLICTVNDISILVKNGVIENWLDPESAVHLPKKLCQDLYVKQFHYHDVCLFADMHCKRMWPRLRVIYLSKFTSPWAVASQIVGGIILILTFLQTLFSIIK